MNEREIQLRAGFQIIMTATAHVLFEGDNDAGFVLMQCGKMIMDELYPTVRSPFLVEHFSRKRLREPHETKANFANIISLITSHKIISVDGAAIL